MKYNCKFITIFSLLLNFVEAVKVFTLFTGNTNELQKIQVDLIYTLQNRIENVREVSTVDESDIVLVLCPIVSRTGTDIEAAVKHVKDNTGC